LFFHITLETAPDYSLVSKKTIWAKNWHAGLAPGPGNLGQKCVNLTPLWRFPQKNKIENFAIFLKLWTKSLSASLKGLISSLAQWVGKLWPDEITGTIVTKSLALLWLCGPYGMLKLKCNAYNPFINSWHTFFFLDVSLKDTHWLICFPIEEYTLRKLYQNVWLASASFESVGVGEGGVQSTHFCIFNSCYFISSPNKLKICHTIKQLCTHNIVPKHENNALQKQFYNQFEKGTFSVECAPCMGTLGMSMGYTWPINKKLGFMHCIMFTWWPMWNRHLLTASPHFSHSNCPLSLHGKTNLYDYQTSNETNAVCLKSCFTIEI